MSAASGGSGRGKRWNTDEELVREFTKDPKDEEVSIDELLLTIDELQKEEQKNT